TFSARRRERLVELEAKELLHPGAAGRRQTQRARLAQGDEPFKIERSPPDRRADPPGDVKAPLAPVEAWPAEAPARGGFRRDVGAEFRQKGLPCVRHFAAVIAEH